MKIYHVESRGNVAIRGACGLLMVSPVVVVGGLFVVVSVLEMLELMTLDHDTRFPTLGGICGAVILISFAAISERKSWSLLWRLPYEMRVSNDGAVVIVSVLRASRVRAHDIRVIEKGNKRFVSENGDARELRIRHSGGSVAVTYFAGVEEFIADVKTLNPSIAVIGQWPT